MSNGDPNIDRLEDALSRSKNLMDGTHDKEVVAEIGLLREDLLFVYRSLIKMNRDLDNTLTSKMHALESKVNIGFKTIAKKLAGKVDRNPSWAKVGWLVAGTVISVVGGYILWQLTTGSTR